MSIRRPDTKYHRYLLRTCETCGKTFWTSAGSPFARQMPKDGKKQATVYFCSESCKKASYKHLFDGKAAQRRKEREAKRNIKEKNRRYYERHAEQLRERKREQYWADPERARKDNAYQRKKRKLCNNKIGEEIPC